MDDGGEAASFMAPNRSELVSQRARDAAVSWLILKEIVFNKKNNDSKEAITEAERR